MTDSSKPDMTAKLREALDLFTRRFETIRLDVTADGRSHFMGSLSSEEYAAYNTLIEAVYGLLESPDIILIRKVEGEWPEEVVESIAKAIYETGRLKGGTWNKAFPESKNASLSPSQQAPFLVRAAFTLDALSDSLAKEGER